MLQEILFYTTAVVCPGNCQAQAVEAVPVTVAKPAEVKLYAAPTVVTKAATAQPVLVVAQPASGGNGPLGGLFRKRQPSPQILLVPVDRPAGCSGKCK